MTVTYNGINTFLVAVGGLRDTVPLGVGPILFGVFTVAWDELFLLCKRTLARILRDARQSAGR